MARKIKFALEMKDGAKVRNSLEELRENFDLEKAVGYFLSGKLTEWLEDRYYEDEAEALDAIDKDAPDLRARLCEALGVECADDEDLDVGALERLNEKKAILRQKTSDEAIIANADKTALTQEDLADLLDMDEPVIYLCGDSFNIPARVKNKKYIGVLGTPTISIKANSQEDLDAKGIVFENVKLPWVQERPETDNKTQNSLSTTEEESTCALPMEQLKELFQSIYKKELEEYCYSGTPQVWDVMDLEEKEHFSGEFNTTQKTIALNLICKGKYKENDLIFIRVSSDFKAGWAFTKDSFCFGGNIGSGLILYNNIESVRAVMGWADKNGFDVTCKDQNFYHLDGWSQEAGREVLIGFASEDMNNMKAFLDIVKDLA